MYEGDELQASDARHPIVERHVSEAFVPNDVLLNGTDRQLVILTGPNMGGKSTYLRQVALLSLLVLLEKLTPVGRWIARTAGVACIASGALMLLSLKP